MADQVRKLVPGIWNNMQKSQDSTVGQSPHVRVCHVAWATRGVKRDKHRQRQEPQVVKGLEGHTCAGLEK